MKNAYYLERTASGTSCITLGSKLFDNRILYLDSEISNENINELIRSIMILESESNDPITLIIDSPGGSIQSGLALVDVIKSSSCEIKTLVLGMAASMAAIIASAGTKGHRYISKHSRVMIHEPLLQSGVTGSCSSIQATAKAIMERKNLINKLLSEYTGNDEEYIEKSTNFDNYMSASEAVDFGLIDQLVDGKNLSIILKGGK